ncbi:hypothetical protein J1N35_014608 [Gossypium stocksii]|uniref:Uncharacterized protein n=1 Tax=Gossypium stocksii TaxID=47602 RepID=A0A9D4AA24_9ROSI|nr:hypothetical protein J1N35_014608 [Gossypium stocksii]
MQIGSGPEPNRELRKILKIQVKNGAHARVLWSHTLVSPTRAKLLENYFSFRTYRGFHPVEHTPVSLARVLHTASTCPYSLPV